MDRLSIGIFNPWEASADAADDAVTFAAYLSQTKDTHVCFVAPGDSLQPGALEQAESYLDRCPHDMVQLPVFKSWDPATRHVLARRFGRAEADFEPAKAASKTPLSLYGLVVSKALLESLQLSDHAFEADGVEVVYKALEACPRIGFAWSEAGYLKSKRTQLSAYNRQERTADQVRDAIEAIESATGMQRPTASYQRALIVHGLLDCCQGAHPESLYADGNLTPLGQRVRDVARLVGPKFILTGKGVNLSFEQKALLFRLQRRSITKELRAGRYADFSMLPVKIGALNVVGEKLVIEALYWTFGADGLALQAVADRAAVYAPMRTTALHCSFDCTVGAWKLAKTNYSVFEVPLDQAQATTITLQWRAESEAEAEAQAGAEAQTHQAPCALTNSRSRFAFQDTAVPVRMGDFDVVFAGNAITATPTNAAQPFVDALAQTTDHIGRAYNIDASLRLIAKQEKRYLLLTDRPDRAGDNGYALFDHIMRNESDELRQNTYYAIRSNAIDFHELDHRDHLVEFGSERHKQIFLNARWVFASHIDRAYFCPFSNAEFKYYADLLDYDFVWLQHGITKDDVSGVNNRFYAGVDYVVAATRFEHESFLAPQYFYQPEKVLLTGFPRFDLLENAPENVIAIMPTWRRYLSSAADAQGIRVPKPGFESFAYAQAWAAVLANPRLLASLEERDFKLVFVTHPAFACYKRFFKQFESERVLVDPLNESYRSLFGKSRMVITDYSSAVFDFAYLEKPVVYFQFDEAEFFAKHTTPGYFDYRNDGFGPVVATADAAVDAIERGFEEGFAMEAAYRARVRNTFASTAGNASRSVLKAVGVLQMR